MLSVYVKEMRMVLSSDLSGLFNTVTKLLWHGLQFQYKKKTKLETVNLSNFSTVIADIINFMI